MSADNNKTQDGAYLDNDAGTGNIIITGVTSFSGNGNGNGDDGLYITSKGNVNLVDLVATGNRDEGVEIQNTASKTSGTVQIDGTNLFTGNKGVGLLIRSKGDVLLANLTSQGNGGDGVNIANHTSTTNAVVTITGANDLSGNTSDGLYVRSKGTITLENVIADNNKKDSGARLDNDEAGAVGNIVISGTNSFSGNNDWGLMVYSRGDLVFENVSADNNKTQDGAYLDNDAGTGDVNINGVNSFSGNGNGSGDDGLYVTSKGNIELNQVAAYASPDRIIAEGNKGSGVRLDNDSGIGSVLVGGFGNSISNNAYDGLWVSTHGNVDIYHLTAGGNGKEGVEIITAASAPNEVNFYCSFFGNNGTYGVYGRYARGAMTFHGESIFVNNPKGDYYYQTASGVASFDPEYDCNLPDPPAPPADEDMGGRRTETATTLLIPVTGGQLLPISCEYPQTTLELSETQWATFINLCGYDALLDSVVAGDVPEGLLESSEFVSGLTVALFMEDEPVDILPDGSQITLSFAVPAGQYDKSFTILYWDAEAVNGIGGWSTQAVPVVDGLVEITFNFTGTFFLLSQ